MQPDFATLKPIEEQPDFGTLKPEDSSTGETVAPQPATPKMSFADKLKTNANILNENVLGSNDGEQNLLQKVVSDPFKTLVIKPGVRFGQMIGTLGMKAKGVPQEQIDAGLAKGVDINIPLLGNIFIEPQRKGVSGASQITGDAFQAASYLPSVKFAKAISGLVKGSDYIKPIVGSMAAGLQGGALQGAGTAIAEEKNVRETVKDTIGYGLLGAGLGLGFGVLGAAIAKTSKFANKVSTEEGAVNELADRYRVLLNLRQTQIKREARSGKDVADFLAREFRDEPILGVNSEGRLDTSDAVSSLKLKYGAEESVFDDMLSTTYKFNSIDELKEKMVQRATKMFKGTAQDDALVHIEREMEAYKRQFSKPGMMNEEGKAILSLEDQNVIKRDLWNKSKKKFNSSNSDALYADINYQMGNTLKDHIEKQVPDLPIKDLNSRLGDYANAIRLLEERNGGVLPGGRLGRGFTRVAGAVVGVHTGDLPGGIVGTITADKLSEFMMDPNYSTYFIRKVLAGLPPAEKNKVLQEAQDIIENRLQERVRQKLLPAPSYMEGQPFKGINREPVVVGGNPPADYAEGLARKYQSQNQSKINEPITNESAMVNNIGGNDTMKGVSSQTPNKQGGFISLQPYKETGNLTTKILRDLEGKTTVSKQYILDATNRGDLKQVERDLIRSVADTMPDGQINVSEFAEKVKAELLPLKVEIKSFAKKGANGYEGSPTRYESVTLPDELRGKVSNYKENIYESPIKTSAGETHFPGKAKNYFGHTRIEDMADNKTRRVIEVQSDLYQKGRLEDEYNIGFYKNMEVGNINPDVAKQIPEGDELIKLDKLVGMEGKRNLPEKTVKRWEELSEKAFKTVKEKRSTEVAKLQQYNDPTAHFRMVREEIKKAAQDGKTKLQFPTGETAMKIEGLGDATRWAIREESGTTLTLTKEILDQVDKKRFVGTEVFPTSEAGDSWIITDVLGDGKFKAVPRNIVENSVGDIFPLNNSGDIEDAITYMSHHSKNTIEMHGETFDISGKVDTNNPIYKFYEKDIQKYLNKFGGKKVVDDKGVSWIEVPIKKEWAKEPVDAFGKAMINPLFLGAGITGGIAGVTNLLKDDE